jgi:hypothetical protein
VVREEEEEEEKEKEGKEEREEEYSQIHPKKTIPPESSGYLARLPYHP